MRRSAPSDGSTLGEQLAKDQTNLEKYKTGKGSIQFPYDKRLPKALIRKIAAFRVKELREKDVRWM